MSLEKNKKISDMSHSFLKRENGKFLDCFFETTHKRKENSCMKNSLPSFFIHELFSPYRENKEKSPFYVLSYFLFLLILFPSTSILNMKLFKCLYLRCYSFLQRVSRSQCITEYIHSLCKQFRGKKVYLGVSIDV